MMQWIKEQWDMAVYWLLQYNDEGLHFILMFAALLYIVLSRKEKTHRKLFAGYFVIFTIVYFCPLTSYAITRAIGTLVYWRVLWLLPMPVIIAFAMVKLWDRIPKKWMRGAVLAVFGVLLVLGGQVIYIENCPYEVKSNWEKIPASPVAICDIINANRGEDEWVLLAAPEDMVPWIRVYDASIHQVNGRKGNYWMPGSGGRYIVKALDDEALDYETLTQKCRRISCNYIVLPDGAGRVEGMQQYQFEVIGRVGSYIIFKDITWTE